MRAVTHCPACQTEFFVTDEQLQQHHGKVRCGQCLHVFDAKAEILESSDSEVSTDNPISTGTHATADNTVGNQVETINIQVVPAELETTSEKPAVETHSEKTTEDIFIGDYQPSNFDDLAGKSKLSKSLPKGSRKKLWWFLIVLFILLAIAQSIFFLRNDIAIYYPNFKPYLVKACLSFKCTIELPKKIEFIVIDDSDIQEDADYKGLMRLSSTLINQATFNQAYPKLELTLTDVEDKPKLRRIFTPKEYLPAHTDISKGLAPSEEVKIRLAMTTDGEAVAGYRVYVSY